MIDHIFIASQLEKNKEVFSALLKDIPENEYKWKPKEDKWSLLEIICHLIDEEKMDFRFRARWTLERPGETPPPIDPVAWVTKHRYSEQDFNQKLAEFELVRDASVAWLRSLKDPDLSSSYEHVKLGTLSSDFFIKNWLAHDYLHIRQINKLKFDYLRLNSDTPLDYAGEW